MDTDIKTSLCVIESHDENGVEWGLSFDGHNPNSEDFFAMDKETAFRLQEKLAKRFPAPNSDRNADNSPI